MISLKNAAIILGITESGLRKLVDAEAITYFQTGKKGRIKFKQEWIDQYIDRHTHQVATPAPKMIKQKKRKKILSLNGQLGFNWDLIKGA